jgi:tetratricopeptide (TPR) repeat protein
LIFRSIDNDIVCVSTKQALKRLREIEKEVKETHPGYLAQVEYLRGRCYNRKETTLERAKKHFQQAIRIFDQHQAIQHTYFKAASLYHLSRIAHVENKLEEALALIQAGLEAIKFCSKENGNKIIYHLLICKTIYLEKLDRDNEANETLKIMWDQGLERIRTEVFLNMCQLQAEIYKKQKSYNKAIEVALLGTELAKKEAKYDRCFELWTTLGSIYKEKKQFHLTKICLQTALNFKDKVKKAFLVAQNYTELGSLYLLENKVDEAQVVLEKALKTKTTDVVSLCDTFETLGTCFLQKGNIREAIKQWEKARDLAAKHSLRLHEYKNTLKLTRHYESINVIKHKENLKRLFQLDEVMGGDTMSQQVEAIIDPINLAGDPPDF